MPCRLLSGPIDTRRPERVFFTSLERNYTFDGRRCPFELDSALVALTGQGGHSWTSLTAGGAMETHPTNTSNAAVKFTSQDINTANAQVLGLAEFTGNGSSVKFCYSLQVPVSQ